MATEHLTDDRKLIPAGLLKRWEEFGRLSKECWERVKELDLPVGEAFSRYFSCMSSKGAHLMSVEEAKRYKVKPHPIAVMAKMAKGMSREEAEKSAIAESKLHPISLMRAEIEMAREKGEL